MRRLQSLALAVVMMLVALSAGAQELVKQRVGVYNVGGEVVVAEATTTLCVELVVEHEEFVAGPYARYAQRLLGERAPLVGRDEYRVVKADVSLLDADSYYRRDVECVSGGGVEPFGTFLIDRLSTTDKGAEEAATDAANQIYALRRARLDLVTGEHGDGVFGAGLKSALHEIEALERAYLELFFGRRAVSSERHTIVVAVDGDRAKSIIARFSPEEGLVATDNLSGDIVMLTIRPSEMNYPESNPKGRIIYRYANNARVEVTLAERRLAERILPIFEFGETVQLLAPTK